MEYLSGKSSIRNIFLDHWFEFFLKFEHVIRLAIISNVLKVICCKTNVMGFTTFRCLCCDYIKRVKHTCKSRFCSSCGKKATEQWILKNLSALPNVPWQQITFTLPKEFRELFWLNRHLFNELFPIPASILTTLAKEKNIIPGIFAVLHTFGRDLKPNVHFHIMVSLGGLTPDKTSWKSKLYFDHKPIKAMWRHRVLKKLEELYQTNQLILPKKLGFIRCNNDFTQWLQPFYEKKWVVHLAKPEKNHKRNVKYVARYLKKPPISETRITGYNRTKVDFIYRDHHDNKIHRATMLAQDFIQRLIRHIPDHHFRLIRYYNWLSNRNRGKDLPLVKNLLNAKEKIEHPLTWRQLFISTFHKDPLLCPNCQLEMKLENITFGSSFTDLMQRAYAYLGTLKKSRI